jgi:predicted HAD superfamily Cof-like phosphohydrolase
MHKAQAQVRDFMRAIGQPSPNDLQVNLPWERLALRRRLIAEEAKEFEEAATIPDQIDALCDLLYVTYGAAVEMGIDLESFFELVHEANLRKVPGPVREDGKKLKPEGWKPPDIEGELRRVMREIVER